MGLFNYTPDTTSFFDDDGFDYGSSSDGPDMSWLDTTIFDNPPEYRDTSPDMSWLDESLFDDIPEMRGDGSIFDYDDESEMNFNITDYVDPLTGIGVDNPFYIDFSNIPEMRGDGSIFDYDDESEMNFDANDYIPEEGPLGGQLGPWLRNLFVGSGSGPLGGNVLGGGEGGGGILGALLGLGGGGGGKEGEGGLGGLLGGLAGGNPLLTFLAMKSLMKDEPSAAGSVPIGGEAYGGPKFNYQDYQPTNLQPALMPGVGYANQGGVPGMMGGGSTDQRPGDITFAKLEPGEFVIQKPAVDAVGIETLEQINNMGNGRSYNG